MKILIFGGTSEGAKLSTALSMAGHEVTLSVATPFGGNKTENNSMTILVGRLLEEDIFNLLKQGVFDYVIDATHPYAVFATQNIFSACKTVGQKYLRLKRPESAEIRGAEYAADVYAAVEILKKNDEKALLTIGSKELEPFTHVENYRERFFVRILPMQESLKKTIELGFCGSNIICMQGPFDKEMNMATIKMCGAKYLVTKESGDAGGFEAKISAALSLGCEVIVISRPVQEKGYTLNELLELFHLRETLKQRAFFPLFIDINCKKILVIGCGNVAERRIKILASFGADVTVISPKITKHIKAGASKGTLRLIERKYKKGDIRDLKPLAVFAATDDRQANHEAMKEALDLDIPVSVADCGEECTCYFPAIAESENYIAGLVSKNHDHPGVKRRAEKIRKMLNT